MMVEQLEEQIRVVAVARQKAQEAKNIKELALSKWEDENQLILAASTLSHQKVIESEDVLRALTLKAYAETGDKAPAPGVGIRERTVLTYDNKVAFDWAKAHKMALKLDTSAFEKIAKADPPDFVKITTEPQATIATNLEVKDGS